MNNLSELKIGDIVERNMCGVLMQFKITHVMGNYIYCGPYKFSMKTGAEIDEELGWDENKSGSFIQKI